MRVGTCGIALALALAGCAPGGAEPDLLLVVIDSLRADRLGAYGYPRPTSPNLDALAEEGVVFTEAWSSSSWTKPSVGSLFTSRLPSEHGAVTFDRVLDPALPTLAQRLRAAGYRTVGVSGNFVHVSERNGFHRGFEVWRAFGVPPREARGDTIWSEDDAGPGRGVRLGAADAGRINQEVAAAIAGLDAAPLFLYVHYMEPHPGFAPPARHRRAFVEGEAGPRSASTERLVDLAAGRAEADAAERRHLGDLYDAEIAAVDEGLGALLALLEKRRPGRERVVAVVADHGEELADHGRWFHGLTLHREVLRVPLVLWDSRRRGPPRRRSEPVDLLDVPTTLLAVAGAEPAEGMLGRDLLASDAPLRPRALLAELHPDPPFESHVLPREHRLAYQAWPWKAIVAGEGPLLFDVARDPEERRPVASGAEEVPESFRSALAALRRRLPEQPASAPGAPLDPEVVEGLRELGYVR